MTLQTELQTFIITVGPDQVSDVIDGVKKLNKLVKRHGQEVVIASKVRVEEEDARGRIIPTVKFTITAPAVAGEVSKLIGTFELAEDGVSVYQNMTPGHTHADMEPFLARWQECDHCNKKRARKASFVCERADGSRLLIGRQCAQAYIGISFEELTARLAVIKALSSVGDDEEGFFGGGPALFDVYSVARYAYLTSLYFKGYSRAVSEDFRHVFWALHKTQSRRNRFDRFDRIADEIDERVKNGEYPKGEDIPYAAFDDYVAGLDGDFGETVKIAWRCRQVKYKRLNTLIAAIGLFVGRRLKDAEKPSAGPLTCVKGDEGDKVSFTALCTRVTPYENAYGYGVVIAFKGDLGENAVWFTSGNTKAREGERYVVNATIKRHGTNQKTRMPETTLLRCKLEQVKSKLELVG